MKRCLTIQDYSCMGRCSLTVALPILSAAGIETIGLPTAVLSNHTAFAEWNYTDLSAELIKNVDMWKDYNNHFDCIYTGYLGNGQAEIIIEIFKKLKKQGTFIVVDPAYGDNGKLYAGFGKEHVDEMKGLLSYADVICPNITEAASLLGIEYPGEKLDVKECESIVKRLSQLGPKKVVLTGVLSKEKDEVGCITYDQEKDELKSYFTENLQGRYHGAGDTFASVMVSGLLHDVSLYDSVKIAHDFVHESMKENLKNNVDGVLYGLVYEGHLHELLPTIEKHK